MMILKPSDKMTKISVGIDDKEPVRRKVSEFVFWNQARISIMILSLACLTLAQMNSLTFNFTVICMDDLVEEHRAKNSTDVHWMESPTEKSLIFSGVAIGSIMGLIPSVPLINIMGVRNILTLSGILSAVGSFFFPIATSFNFYAVFLCRILQGLGISVLFTVVGVIPGVWAPNSEMGTFLAVLSCAFQLSNIICMPVSGVLCESSLGWRSIYYIFGTGTIIFFALFYYFYKDSPRIHRNVSHKELCRIESGKATNSIGDIPYIAICKDTCVLVAWLSVFGGNLGFFILVLYGPTYLREVLNFDVRGTGFASAFPFLLSAVVKLVAGQITDRLTFVAEKPRFVFCAAVSQIGLAVSFIVMALTTNRLIAQIAYTAAITFSGLNIMGTIKCVQLRCRQHVSFAVAVISFKACIIQFIAPMAVGFLCPDNTAEEWSHLFIGVAVIVLIANAPFPFLTTAEPADFVKSNIDNDNNNNNP